MEVYLQIYPIRQLQGISITLLVLTLQTIFASSIAVTTTFKARRSIALMQALTVRLSFILTEFKTALPSFTFLIWEEIMHQAEVDFQELLSVYPTHGPSLKKIIWAKGYWNMKWGIASG